MKKFSFISATVVMAAAVVLLVSCQKDQVSTTDDSQNNNIVSGSEGAVVGSAGIGRYAGSIPSSYAVSLASNYSKKYGDDDTQAQSVAFSAKDLIAFIQGLQTKYKSDVIYVNFGVYGKGAVPVSSKDWGKLTVFFTGNKIPGNSSNGTRRDDDTNLTPDPDQFLNHGQIFP